MRTMIATMLLPLLALVGVEIFTRTSNVSATPTAAAAEPASCRVDGSGRLRVIEHGTDRPFAEAHQFDTARNGGLTAYAALLPNGLEVLVCSEAGNVLHHVTVPGDDVAAATAVTKVCLPSATRAFVQLHVNPSTDLGLLLDLQTGERRGFEGHHFSLSPDGKDVAYFREPPHGPGVTGSSTPAGLYVNGNRLAEVPQDSGLSLRWNADRTLTGSVRAWNGAAESYDLKPF